MVYLYKINPLWHMACIFPSPIEAEQQLATNRQFACPALRVAAEACDHDDRETRHYESTEKFPKREVIPRLKNRDSWGGAGCDRDEVVIL